MKFLYLAVILIVLFYLRRGFKKVASWGVSNGLLHIFFIFFLVFCQGEIPYRIGSVLAGSKFHGSYVFIDIHSIPNIISALLSFLAIFFAFSLAEGSIKLSRFFKIIPLIVLNSVFVLFQGAYYAIQHDSVQSSSFVIWVMVSAVAILAGFIYFLMYQFYSKNYFGPRG